MVSVPGLWRLIRRMLCRMVVSILAMVVLVLRRLGSSFEMSLSPNVSKWVYPKFQNKIVFTYRRYLLQCPYTRRRTTGATAWRGSPCKPDPLAILRVLRATQWSEVMPESRSAMDKNSLTCLFNLIHAKQNGVHCRFWYQPLEIGWLKIVQACINHRLLSSLMSTNPNSLPCLGVASAASVLCEGPWCVRSTHQLEQVSVHQWCVDLRLHEGRRTAMSTILTRFGNISFWMCLATCVKWCSVGAPLLPKNTYSIMFICMSLYVQICFVCMFRLYRGGGVGCMLTGCVRGLCKACGAWSEHVR